MCVKYISFFVLILIQIILAQEKTQKQNGHNHDFAYPDDLDLTNFRRQNFKHSHHHHHFEFHHNPEFHKKNEDKPLEEPKLNNETFEIPLDYIQNLNEYNVSDLLIQFVDGEEESFIQNRFGDDEAQERSAATMPKGAECMPELTTVKIASSDDPSVLYIPQCTRIERCGGCCKHDLLSCQPLKKEFLPFKIYKTQYTGGKKLRQVKTEVVLVEKHNKCKCLCRVKAEDCTKFQEYRESECRCSCVNFDEKKKCLRNNETKLWNPELCSCQCRDVFQCSTGSYFDQNECKCIALPINRRIGNLQRRNSRVEPPPVIPLNEDY